LDLMVHRSAPPRLTGAFGVMLLVGGAAAAVRWAIVRDTPIEVAAYLMALALGAWIVTHRESLTYRQVGWIAIACTPMVAAVVAGRDDPSGGGYAFIWGAPFAYAAGRRVGYAHTAAVALCLAAAFGVQALRVDDPAAFHTYAGWWLTATVSAAIVGGVTRVIWESLESAQRQIDRAFDQGVLGMAVLDLGGRWQQVNRALAEILGRSPEALAGTPAADITHLGDRAITLEQIAQATDLGQVAFDKRYVRPDGSVRWVTVHAAVLRDARGAATGLFSEYEDITAQREAEERLRASEHRFERMFHDAGVGMLLVAVYGSVQQANRAAAEILRTTPEGLVGTDIRAWRHPDDAAAGEAAAEALDAGTGDVYHRDGRYVGADGQELHLAVTVAVVRDDGGTPEYVMVQLADVSDRDAAQRREAALAELGRLALAAPSPTDLLPDTVRVVAETLHVRFATVVDAGSREVLAAHGWDGEAAVGHALAALDVTEPLVFRDPAIELRFPTSALAAAGAVAGAAVVVTGAGDADAPFAVLTVHASIGARRFGAGDLAFLASAANVLTAAVRRDAAERELRHRALHDPVTRLPNRALLVDRLRHALTRSRREHRTVAALFLDVDDFKDINDRHGHEGGDALLKVLGPRLQGAMRANDTLARFGADEFVVVCEDLEDPEEALSVADRLLAAVAEPCTIAGHAVRRTASIGIALSQAPDDADPDTLLRDADLAMHRAKLAGKGRYEVFAHAMREVALDRVAMLNDLDRAIAEDELSLAYQPIVRLTDGGVHAAEALVRWHHPERGTIMPDEFIGLAERTGRIVELGHWVLREAARQAARWPELIVGVNVSRVQLTAPGFVDDVAHVLGAFGVAPRRFTVEVTETALMEDPAAAESTLLALRDLGVRIALDDFGTGYSSLSSVSDFPLDTLKLDRAFLADHRSEAQRWSIVRAVLDMARTLDLSVVVEGIETQAQRAALMDLGAVHGQGYLFSRPLPAGELTAMLGSGPAAWIPSR
jgi:diguanylate cyclase (GGDEF)-like protein/PAS domain S-box-containing protein